MLTLLRKIDLFFSDVFQVWLCHYLIMTMSSHSFCVVGRKAAFGGRGSAWQFAPPFSQALFSGNSNPLRSKSFIEMGFCNNVNKFRSFDLNTIILAHRLAQ